MQEYANGMSAGLIPGQWIKSRKSEANGTCIEAVGLPGGGVALRNSRDANGPALVYTVEEFDAFLDGAKKGEFDHLAVPN
ncbi:DUF397 domain-containing protein [Streptomyces sp. NPDC087300]|uniref:DUF397 domain-containing protein n=1 Tax=Streptomyces sp. NPDC087300 TaxID=3365780 RepID=UPI00380AF63B